MEPPPGFGPAEAAPGSFSDESAQALGLLDSLFEAEGFDAGAIRARLSRWRDQQKPSVGALIGAVPLGLWHRGSDEALVRDARAAADLLAGDRRVRIVAALVALAARTHLEAAPSPWPAAERRLAEVLGQAPPTYTPRPTSARPHRNDPVTVLDAARAALVAGPFEAAVKAAVAGGNATSATAALAGAFAGLREGLGAIPAPWRRPLRGSELWGPLVGRLLERHGLAGAITASPSGRARSR
jgi:hypothetical protein